MVEKTSNRRQFQYRLQDWVPLALSRLALTLTEERGTRVTKGMALEQAVREALEARGLDGEEK